MPTAGQPTSYKPDYCAQAHNYCLLGATNEDLAGFFDVTRRTIDNWIASHADFAAAVRSGRVIADMRVARCLYERAVGWQQTVERTVLHQGAEKVLKNIVNHPPDVRACIFWLRNRRRASWATASPCRTTTRTISSPPSTPRANVRARSLSGRRTMPLDFAGRCQTAQITAGRGSGNCGNCANLHRGSDA